MSIHFQISSVQLIPYSLLASIKENRGYECTLLCERDRESINPKYDQGWFWLQLRSSTKFVHILGQKRVSSACSHILVLQQLLNALYKEL